MIIIMMLGWYLGLYVSTNFTKSFINVVKHGKAKSQNMTEHGE